MRTWGATAITAVMIVAGATVAHAAIEDDLRDGDKYFEDGNWQKAAVAYDRAIAKAPGQVPAEAYGKRAAIFIILKDYKGGLDFIAKAKASSSTIAGSAELGEQEALLLWETDHKDEAIKIAEKVVSSRPQTFTNQALIGEYYATRSPARTVTAYEAYLANRPNELEGGDVLPRIRLGFSLLATARGTLNEGDEAKAKSLYEKAVGQFDTVARKFGKKPNAQVNADNGLCAAYTGLGQFDQAVTVCERVIQDPKRIDTTGAVWFNLGTAYLARKQTKKARTAANEFTRVRKNEARGFKLIGDTFFADRDWTNALDAYLRAEKLLKPNQAHDQVQLSIQLGKTYRRLPAPASGTNPNLALAIDKLNAAYAANTTSTELAIELGGAYLEGKQDAKATALSDRLLANPELAKAPAEQRAGVLLLAGKSLYNQKKLKEARQRFEAAAQIRPNDVSIQRNLVLTINEQAFSATSDAAGASALLEQALAIDPASPVTLTNLAVLAIDRGQCEPAQKQLIKLAEVRGHDEVLRTRLLARTFVCQPRPDLKRAAEAYANAEKEAKKAGAALALAEIYVEWAPLLLDSDLSGAIDKLETAVQTGGSDAEIAPAAKRNLALALFRRGWKQMRENKIAEATQDFERATRDTGVLKGTEPLAFEFSYGLALIDAGRAGDAAKLFKGLGAKGNQAAYLKGAYAKFGSQFFGAYANYRSGTLAARQQATSELGRLEGEPGFGTKVRDLLGSAFELIAFEQWRSGQVGAASKSLDSAAKYADNDAKRRITMDKAALSLGKGDLAALEALGGNPPEVLVNLGILYDQAGRPKDAYDAWVKAKARGVQVRDLQKWIDAKKRIYGF